jgi:hypothetical protein
MVSVFDSLAWKLTRQLDPGFPVSPRSPLSPPAPDFASGRLRAVHSRHHRAGSGRSACATSISPFCSAPSSRLRGWRWAARSTPGKQYEQAAVAFAKVGRNDPLLLGADALEAGFYRGLALLFSGDYPRAEESFAGVARVLPLAEVLNNQGVALARRGQGRRSALPSGRGRRFQQRRLPLQSRRQPQASRRSCRSPHRAGPIACKLRPNDAEAQAVQSNLGPRRPRPPSPWSSRLSALQLRPLRREKPPRPPMPRPTRWSASSATLTSSRLSPGRADHRSGRDVTPRDWKRWRLAAGSCAEAHPRRPAITSSAVCFLEAERARSSRRWTPTPNPPPPTPGWLQVHERTGDAEAARKEAVGLAGTVALRLMRIWCWSVSRSPQNASLKRSRT